MLSYHMQGIIATIMLLYDDNLFIISLKKDAGCVNIKSFLVRQRNKTSIKCLFYFFMVKISTAFTLLRAILQLRPEALPLVYKDGFNQKLLLKIN